MDTESSFIAYNGDFIKKEKFSISFDNRAFMYGDSLFESILAFHGKLPFFESHISRLLSGIKLLNYLKPYDFNHNKLESIIKKLLLKNKIFKTARVRIQVYRNPGGLYTPIDNNFNYIITTEKMPDDYFGINEKGYDAGVYTEIKKPCNQLSALKTGNSLLYILASEYKKQKMLDEVLLLNTKECVVEASSSNIFVVKNSKVYTPPLSEGCVDGIMRKTIIKTARKNGIVVQELPLRIKDVMNSDEIFLTNAVKGIQWVVALYEKRYFNKTAKKISLLLSELIKK